MHYYKWHLANNIIIIHSCALLLFGWAAFRLQPCLEEIQRDLPVRLHILSSTEPIWQRITTATRLTNNLSEIWDRSATASGHRPVPSHRWVRVFIAADAVLAQPSESLVYFRARKMNCEGGGIKINHFLRWPFQTNRQEMKTTFFALCCLVEAYGSSDFWSHDNTYSALTWMSG